MRIQWFGQSAFLIEGEQTVFIDPFGAMEGLTERGMQFDYPPVENVQADLLLVTHEHADHNVVEAIRLPLASRRCSCASSRPRMRYRSTVGFRSPTRPTPRRRRSASTSVRPCATSPLKSLSGESFGFRRR